MKAWYFATAERRLRYGDNRPIILRETHKVEGPLELCKNGLHASERLIDALSYAPGCILYEVALSGEILKGADKLCASERTYLRELDATDILREFAREAAASVVHLIKPYCSKEDFLTITQFLEGGGEADAAAYAADARAAAAYAAAYAAANAAYAAADAAYAANAAAYAAANAANAAYAAYAAAYAADAAADAANAGSINLNDLLTRKVLQKLEVK